MEKIGPVMSAALVRAGIASLDALEAAEPRWLETIVGRHAPFGSELVHAVRALPKHTLTVVEVTN